MFEHDTLKSLVGFRDDVGVLSLYAGFTPEQAADPQPVAPIEIRNQVRDLKRRLRDSQPHAVWQAVEERLDDLDTGDFDGLLDPKAHGRGRALFVGVSDGRQERVHLQVPFQDRVIFDATPFLRPLVAALDEGRPAGILLVNSQAVRLLEWTAGQSEELEDWGFELTDAQLADIKSGPSPNNPRMHGGGNVNKERFEDRVGENRHRFLAAFIEDVNTRAAERGWDRIVVAGAPKVKEEVRELIPSSNGRRIVLSEHAWDSAAPHQIAAEAWPALRSVHRQREIELVEAAKDRALSGGAGALGLRKVLKALNQGRVDHLLFQSDLSVEGYRSDEGTLHAEVAGPAAQAGYTMHREPLLIERMVERVMETGGKVTPVDEEASALLGEQGGVGALLRW